MALNQPPELCTDCGEAIPWKDLYDPNPPGTHPSLLFVGSVPSFPDYAGHVCDPDKKAQYQAEQKVYWDNYFKERESSSFDYQI